MSERSELASPNGHRPRDRAERAPRRSAAAVVGAVGGAVLAIGSTWLPWAEATRPDVSLTGLDVGGTGGALGLAGGAALVAVAVLAWLRWPVAGWLAGFVALLLATTVANAAATPREAIRRVLDVDGMVVEGASPGIGVSVVAAGAVLALAGGAIGLIEGRRARRSA